MGMKNKKKLGWGILLAVVIGFSLVNLTLDCVQAKTTYIGQVVSADYNVMVAENGNWSAAITLPGGLDANKTYYFVKQGDVVTWLSFDEVNVLILTQTNYTLWSTSQPFEAEYNRSDLSNLLNFNVGVLNPTSSFYAVMDQINISEQYYMIVEAIGGDNIITIHGLNLYEYEPDEPTIPFPALFTLMVALSSVVLVFYFLKKETSRSILRS